MKTIGIYTKGGVGKSVCVFPADFLASLFDKRVLVLISIPQNNAAGVLVAGRRRSAGKCVPESPFASPRA